MSDKVVTVDIVSDVVCPWCFIGRRRLARAMGLVRAEAPGTGFAVRWHPFFLDPDTPVEGSPYRPYLERKFGGPERLEQIFARLRDAGRSVGIDFALERIALRANTLRAHRLIHRVQWTEGAQADALVERLFDAYFLRGEHVGDAGVLAGIAADCGLDRDEVAAYLAGDEDADTVAAAAARAREIGVSSVPTFIFGGAIAVTGAEDPAVLAAAIRRALAEGAGESGE
ncbi:MAG TPA: DsbA family oxidoreductase [Rhodocyclaceae bacterium]|nr:DsbA family oxidoreductase [Rhodocyclaceae bacterium]